VICESTSKRPRRLDDSSNGEVTKELPSHPQKTITTSLRGQTGLPISSLDAGEVVIVQTANSRYRIVMLDPIEQMVIIRGGRYFPKATEARLLGSSANKKVRIGNLVKGLSLAVAVGRRCFVTSPVKEIVREGH
jgi:hypothetical protein